MCSIPLRIIHSLWKRLIVTASPQVQHRFIEGLDFFFQAVTQQARDRKAKAIPDIESYILLRRDTSGCKPCFALIEYANNLDIPDEVMEHPLIRSLSDATNDHISWSNVCEYLLKNKVIADLFLGHLLLQRRTSERQHP